MDNNIKQILAELYQLEPQLKQHEAQLIKVVEKLLAAKPDTRFDKKFASQLRAELTEQAPASTANLFNFNFMQKFGYLLGGAVIASLLIVPTLLTNFGGSGINLAGLDFNAEPTITLLDDQAFGIIGGQGLFGSEESAPTRDASALSYDAGVNSEAAAGSAVAPMPASITRPQSGGGGMGAGVDAKMMIYPYPNEGPYRVTQFRYNYTGESFSLEADKLEVLRQTTSRPKIGNLASTLSLGLISSGTLSNMKFENVSLSQGTADGARVYTDFVNGEVYISEESGFMMPMGEYRPLTAGEVPTNAKLIEIANAYVKKFGIKLDHYGEPEVLQANRYAVELSARMPDIYIPDIFNVVYPLIVKDLPVYDQGGSKVGLTVGINVRTGKAASINGLSLQQYEASLYPIASDINTLIEKYNAQNDYYTGGEYEIDIVEVNLGTPELVFTSVYTYNNNQSQKLLVPAYRFPVLEKPAGQEWFSDNIVILLVSGLQGDGGPVQIMPAESTLMKTEPGVSQPAPAVIEDQIKTQ